MGSITLCSLCFNPAVFCRHVHYTSKKQIYHAYNQNGPSRAKFRYTQPRNDESLQLSSAVSHNDSSNL